jgi:porphobilinogen synthase
MKNNNYGYPHTRMRRNRQFDWSRRLVAENSLSVNDLILPIFVMEGKNKIEPIASMPSINRHSIDKLVDIVKTAQEVNIPLVAIFPVIDNKNKTEHARESFKKDNLICRAITTIKEKVPDIGVMADVALDPYTSHGHDGILNGDIIDNDKTIDILIKQALNQINAGADIIAPSDMMDGRIYLIRESLEKNGHADTLIMSYAAKYASAFYGPFRDAIKSKGSLRGDKKTYQMDTPNANEAIREADLDISEGADMIMVKPGLPYLDIISKIKTQLKVPTFAYQVSGEYASLKAASNNGWLDFDKVMIETLLCFKRAGADGILTYSAIDVAQKLLDGYKNES